MKQFKTLYTEQDEAFLPEKNGQPSQTVPDMAMSLSEIMRRSAAGLDVLGNRNPRYDDDTEDYELDFVTPEFDKMDLADRQRLAEEAKAEVERLRAVLNQKALEKREADKKAADEKALADFKAMQEKLAAEPERKFIVPRKPDEGTNTP